MSLSLCIIVKIKDDTLVHCLENVKDIVDEIIIVDTDFTYNTVKIAEGFGSNVFFTGNNSLLIQETFPCKRLQKIGF